MGMMGSMIGGGLSSGGRQLIRFVTMGIMIAGAGTAGLGFFPQTLPPQAQTVQTYVKAHTALFIGVGIAAIVLGWVVNMVAQQRMMKKMTAGMPGMGGMGAGGMPDMSGMMAGMSKAQQKEVVKVRCNSCGSLELEEAAFCSKCGKAMTPAPASRGPGS